MNEYTSQKPKNISELEFKVAWLESRVKLLKAAVEVLPLFCGNEIQNFPQKDARNRFRELLREF